MTLSEYKVQEIIDSRSLVSQEKKDEFSGLFKEFLASYPNTPAGQTHIAAYSISRKAGQANLEDVVVAASRGQDVTDDVLLKLLPYVDTPANRSKGGWIHWAPTINGDIRLWFERAGRTKPEDWPQIADAVLRFVQRCVEDPEQLSQAVAEFSALPYSKGLQTGMLTPILNAVRPDDFTLINNKSRALVNYFTGQAFTQPLTDYPSTNLAAQALVRELGTLMHQQEAPALSDSDLFDMFGHWLVAVKRYGFRDTRYFKIAPGESAWQWDDCRQDGFIAIGWDELGDLSGVSRNEYLERRDALCAEHGWTKTAVDQVWAFTSRIREGDRIIANRGKKEVVGIGTVVGPYYFVPGQPNGHRLPVEWDDTTVRSIEELGWQRTLIELDRTKFDSISILSSAAPGNATRPADDASLTKTQPAGRMASPFSVIFDSQEEADWAFDFLADVVKRLGGSGPNDQRFSFTLPVAHKQRLMRLNFCAWMVVDFVRPESGQELQVHITLLSDGMTPLGLHVSMEGPFSQEEGAPEVRIFLLPSSTLKSMSAELRVVYEDSLDYIARKFFSWQTSQYPFAHRQELFEAIFDKELRHRLFAKGMSDRVPTGASIAEGQGEYVVVTTHPEAAFSQRSFELLAGLHEDPSRSHYLAHKEEFKIHVEDPFQRLTHTVSNLLPRSIVEVMEIEKRVFGRFLKNDFGQGGAWNFYWGAFYPKNGKRTEDAQLSLWMNYERLEYGFYIGAYGSAQRRRFQRNCQDHRATLERLLKNTFADSLFVFGERENYQIDSSGKIVAKVNYSLEDFLQDPSRLGNDVSAILPRDQVLQMAASELAAQIAQGFSRLYPLVLLALHDDPMPALADYMEGQETSDGEEPVELAPLFTLAQFAEQTGFDQDTLDRWVRAINRKGQAILYGPPGTGKTFVAERLARHLIGGGDGFCDLVQFHPAYAYEDFIQGIRPQPHDGGGLTYSVVPGRFLEFCRRADQRNGTCVLIVDEINRANLARVFGELMYLLEYRDQEIPLAGGGVLRIPKNVRIIGTMNTADRSIALVDHALRRRFAFLALNPDYEVLRRYHERESTGFSIDGLSKTLRELNMAIGDRHYEVGITFFLRPDLATQLSDIWAMEIEPYLEEYFFDQPEKAKGFRWASVREKILL